MVRVDLRPGRMPAAPFVDNQLDLVLPVEFAEGSPLVGDELLHPVGLVEHLIPLVFGEFKSVAGGAAIIMRRPAMDRSTSKVKPFLEEAPRPVEIVAVRSRGDQIERHAVLREPLGELPIFAAIVFRRELAAAAPALVADAPITNAERFAGTIGGTLVSQGRR